MMLMKKMTMTGKLILKIGVDDFDDYCVEDLLRESATKVDSKPGLDKISWSPTAPQAIFC
jgi:hypothetical protein